MSSPTQRAKYRGDACATPMPCTSQNGGTGETINHQSVDGMTIRETFALAAMQGMLASGKRVDPDLFKEARRAADSMLVELEEK